MLNGKTVLITGGSRGIGKSICIKLASYRANVIIGYRSQESKAEEICNSMIANGLNAEILKIDVNDIDSIMCSMEYIEKKYAKLDALVNNAGIGVPSSYENLDPEAWQETIQTNLTGPFLTTKFAIELLKKSQDGRIVNISSVAALTGGAFGPHYAGTKAGLIGITKSAARELGKYGIKANVIAPGPIESDMTDSLSPAVMNEIIKSTPLGRVGKAEEIAEMVCQLLNPNMGYITGQTLVVDGGRYMI